MRLSVVPALLHGFRASDTALARAGNQTITTDLDVNFLTASFQCSHHGKEWYICTQPDGWGTMFYCPAYSNYNETQLQDVEWGSFGEPTPLTPCFTCPSAVSNCSVVVTDRLAANNISPDQNSTLNEANIMDEAIQYCKVLCESNKEGEACTQDSQCTPGALFCDYATNDTQYESGICKRCPAHSDECFQEGVATSVLGQHNCRDCRLYCYGAGISKVWIEGEHILSQPIDKAIQASHQTASGPIHDCSKLILDPDATCPEAEGKICLVEFKEQFAFPWQVSNQAEKSGCVGVIAFIEPYDIPFSHTDSKLLIPYTYIPIEEGRQLLKNKIGATAKIQVDIFGAGCYPAWESNMCSATWQCENGTFCEFNSVPLENDLYLEGYCRPCPSDPVNCYFDNRQDGLSDTVNQTSIKTVQKVQSCASSCGAELTSQGCKFCTSEVTGFEFGVEDEENQCYLCPHYDLQYPNRIIPLFSENVTCGQLESFFQKLPVSKDSRNCQLAQSMNFICGCDGTGYAGAKTQTKQAVLAWLPRAASILSIMGSSFIIYDTQQTIRSRAKVINKMLCTISVFDAIGSLAMAFTTLPLPETDYIYGSKGNKATCTAQGFFIQMGTIACLLGASLALYYNLTIKQGWSESKLKRTQMMYFLLIPPLVTGFTFAGAGIPFYDNVLVWCNNSERWWPELPVILGILLTTVVMGDVVSSVYKKERASSRYTRGGNTLSRMVFKQAMWFVAAFYITWVPYLALQYMWSSGKGYNMYGFTLAAATLVPLQGFWNCFVYCRPRYFKDVKMFSVASRVISGLKAMRSRRLTEQDSVPTGNQTRVATEATHTETTAIASSAKISVYNQSPATESEVDTFGAPNPDERGASDSDKPDEFYYATCDPNDGSGFDEDNTCEDTHDADDKYPVPKSKEGDKEEDDVLRFEMILAG